MKQEIRFCTASDNTRLAYAKVGQGPPLVKAANWLTHLEYDWNSPVWQPWLENWSRFHALYRYDPRGCGLSDRNVNAFSFEDLVCDLEVVVDAAGLERFDLFGMSQGASVSIAYTAKHPERVRKLIVYGGYARGYLARNPTPEDLEVVEVNLKLLKMSWGKEGLAYRQVFTTQLIPEGTPEQLDWFNNLELVSTTPENAVRIQQTFNMVDVRDLAAAIKSPTLVIQANSDSAVPFEEGRLVASLIHEARFISLNSKNHVLLAKEPAWQHFWDEFYHFLEVGVQPPTVVHVASAEEKVWSQLSARERDVLRLLAEGYTNLEISKKLVLSEKTIRNYVSNIYEKLGITSRGEAIVLARKLGLMKYK